MKRIRVLILRHGRERGAAAVEMALVLPVLVLVIFGIVDYGRLLNAQIMMTEASREGARSAAFGQDSTAVTTRVNDAAPTLGLTASDITITPCPSPSSATDDARVVVTYGFTFITPMPGISRIFGGSMSGSKTLTATGIMPCRT